MQNTSMESDNVINIIQEYEDIMMGRRERFSRFCFRNGASGNHTVALELFRFIFEDCLNWTPEMIRDNITEKLLEKLKVDAVVRYIDFPAELDVHKDLFYIAHLLYPKRIPYSMREQTIRTYLACLNSNNEVRYPRNFFIGSDGFLRAKICLQYMISTYLEYDNIQQLYEMFNDNKIRNVLKDYKLNAACSMIYSTPLEYLHNSLLASERSELWYNFYRYNAMYKKATNAIKRGVVEDYPKTKAKSKKEI